MKIGINARFLAHPYTGIGQYTRHLVQAMAKQSPQDEFVLFVPEMMDLSLPENCHLVRVKEKPFHSPSLQKAYWEHVLVPREMERFGVRLAHFPYPSNPSRKLPFPVVVTVHDVIPWTLSEYRQRARSRFYHFNAKRALKKADHIITVSQFSESEIRKHLPVKNRKITITPLAASPSQTGDSCPNVLLRRPFFIYAGGYDERKNVPRLMDAFQKFIAPYHAVDLVLVGARGKGLEDFLTDEYTQKVALRHGSAPVAQINLKPRGQIVFTDPLEQSELNCLYSKAMALAHVSIYEGFNLSLVEAMRAQIPIVTSDLPVHREVTSGYAVFVDPLSVDSIGLGLHQLVNDRLLQKQLAESQKLVSERYSWKKTAEETLYVYHLFS